MNHVNEKRKCLNLIWYFLAENDKTICFTFHGNNQSNTSTYLLEWDPITFHMNEIHHRRRRLMTWLNFEIKSNQ